MRKYAFESSNLLVKAVACFTYPIRINTDSIGVFYTSDLSQSFFIYYTTGARLF